MIKNTTTKIEQETQRYEEYKEKEKGFNIQIKNKDIENMTKTLFKKEVLTLAETKKSFESVAGGLSEARFAFERNSNTIIGGANAEICIWNTYAEMMTKQDLGFIAMNIDGMNQGYTHFRVDENQGDGYKHIVVSINAKKDATTKYGSKVFINNVVDLVKEGYKDEKIKISISQGSGIGSNNGDIITYCAKHNEQKFKLNSPVNMSVSSYAATDCFLLYKQEGEVVENSRDNVFNLASLTNKEIIKYINTDSQNNKWNQLKKIKNL